MLCFLSLLSAAWADIAPEPPPDKQFATYTVQVDGLDAFPDAVLVLYDAGAETIYGYRPFTSEKARHQIADGGAPRGNTFRKPDLFFMSAAAYAAWSAEATAEIARQREACADRGEGCAHISRFVPRFSPPTGAVPCGAQIDIRTTAPEGGPTAYTDVFTVTAASAEGCTVTGPTPANTTAPPAAPPLADDTAPSAESRCAAVTAAGGAAWGLALLLAGARRRR